MSIDKSLVVMYQKELQDKKNEINCLRINNEKLVKERDAFIKEIEMLKAMQEQKEECCSCQLEELQKC